MDNVHPVQALERLGYLQNDGLCKGLADWKFWPTLNVVDEATLLVVLHDDAVGAVATKGLVSLYTVHTAHR